MDGIVRQLQAKTDPIEMEKNIENVWSMDYVDPDSDSASDNE